MTENLEYRMSEPPSLMTEVETTAEFLDRLPRHLEACDTLADDCRSRAMALRLALHRNATPQGEGALSLNDCVESVPSCTERFRQLATLASLPQELKDALSAGAQLIETQRSRLSEARDLLEDLCEVRGAFTRSRAHRWLHGLPADEPAPLRLGRRPTDNRLSYGYDINGQWVFAANRSPCGQHEVNWYKAYALSAKEVATLARANEQLDRLFEHAFDATTLPAGSDDQVSAEDAFFDCLRSLMSASQRHRLGSLELRDTGYNIQQALRVLAEA